MQGTGCSFSIEVDADLLAKVLSDPEMATIKKGKSFRDIVATYGKLWYRKTHWYDKYENALKKVNAKEKQEKNKT